MHDLLKWRAACLAACEIVRRSQRPVRLYGFSTGGGSTDTRFAREGTSQQDTSTILPALFSTLLSNNAQNSALDANLGAAQRGFLTNLLNDPSSVQNSSVLTGMMGLPQTSGYPGQASLSSMASRNPYSTDFETSTQAAYTQRAGDAIAQSQTGHEAVRGGTARQGIAKGKMTDLLAQGRGQEVRQAQLQDAGIVQGASGLMNMVEGNRRGNVLQAQGQFGGQSLGRLGNAVGASGVVPNLGQLHNMALQIGSNLLGTRTGKVTEDLTGMGNQGTSNWGFNLLGGCCFIFLEALNGKLPDYVEQARLDFYTPTRRKGYKWMSAWLVPAMRRWKVVRHLVNGLMVRPCLMWASHYYGLPGRRSRALLRPVVLGWFCIWHGLGRTVGRRIE